MSKFEEFIKENNYEGDLEYQLCDLELAFDEGMRIGKSQNHWKPSDAQLIQLSNASNGLYYNCETLLSLLEQLNKLMED